jgi:hypothetical protein
MASAKQKAAQARFRAAAAQAKREGAKGKNYAARVGQILRGSGGTRASAASRASPRSPARHAAHAVHSRAKGFLGSLTPAKVAGGLQVLGGLSDSIKNSKLSYANGTDKAIGTLMPLIDGIAAATVISKAAHNPSTAPGLIGDLANWRPFGGKFPKVTARRALNAAPSAVGIGAAFRQYRAARLASGGQFNGQYNLMPRTGAFVGLRLRNANRVGGPWIEPLDLSLPRDALYQGVLQSPAVPLLVGGGASKMLAKAHVF